MHTKRSVQDWPLWFSATSLGTPESRAWYISLLISGSNRNPVSGFFHRNRGPPNFAIRLFVTTKKFRIDYTQTKILYDQLETFGANFTPQILFLILQKTEWPPNFVISPPIITKKPPIRWLAVRYPKDNAPFVRCAQFFYAPSAMHTMRTNLMLPRNSPSQCQRNANHDEDTIWV